MAAKRKAAPSASVPRSSRRTKLEEPDQAPSTPSKKLKTEDDPSPVLTSTPDAKPKIDWTEEDEKKSGQTPLAASKLKKLGDPTQTPFPDFKRPTPEDCRAVCDALVAVHGNVQRPKELVDNDRMGASCGQVPDVLDALVCLFRFSRIP